MKIDGIEFPEFENQFKEDYAALRDKRKILCLYAYKIGTYGEYM